VLGDPHRQRGREAGVLLRREASLGQAAARRGIARLLRDADARGDQGRLGERRLVGRHPRDLLEGAVECRRRAIDLPQPSPRLRRAEPRVHAPRRLTHPERHAERVGGARVGQGLPEERGDRVERVRVRLGAASCFVGTRETRLVVHHLLEQRRRRPRRLGAERPRLAHQGYRRLDLAGRGRGARAVEQKQRVPGRVAGEPGPLRQRLVARGRVPGATGEDLQRQPGARLLRHRGAGDLRRLARGALRLREVRRDVGLIGRPHQQGAHPLVGGAGDPGERVDQLAQVLQAAALLQQANEALERLAERRVRVVGREVIAGRGRLVAAPLLEIGDLGEEPGMASAVPRRRELRAEASHRALERGERLRRGWGWEPRWSRRQRLRGRLADRGRLGHARRTAR